MRTRQGNGTINLIRFHYQSFRGSRLVVVIHVVEKVGQLQAMLNQAASGDIIALADGVFTIDESLIINKHYKYSLLQGYYKHLLVAL